MHSMQPQLVIILVFLVLIPILNIIPNNHDHQQEQSHYQDQSRATTLNTSLVSTFKFRHIPVSAFQFLIFNFRFLAFTFSSKPHNSIINLNKGLTFETRSKLKSQKSIIKNKLTCFFRKPVVKPIFKTRPDSR